MEGMCKATVQPPQADEDGVMVQLTTTTGESRRMSRDWGAEEQDSRVPGSIAV